MNEALIAKCAAPESSSTFLRAKNNKSTVIMSSARHDEAMEGI
jgi:hypothetical protein